MNSYRCPRSALTKRLKPKVSVLHHRACRHASTIIFAYFLDLIFIRDFSSQWTISCRHLIYPHTISRRLLPYTLNRWEDVERGLRSMKALDLDLSWRMKLRTQVGTEVFAKRSWALMLKSLYKNPRILLFLTLVKKLLWRHRGVTTQNDLVAMVSRWPRLFQVFWEYFSSPQKWGTWEGHYMKISLVSGTRL